MTNNLPIVEENEQTVCALHLVSDIKHYIYLFMEVLEESSLMILVHPVDCVILINIYETQD